MKGLIRLSVGELSLALERGDLSSVEITKAYLARIEEVDGKIGAFLTVTRERALKMAEASDQRRKTGKRLSPLDGIPVGYKDNLCTKGVKTTCASKMLAEYRPPYDATAVRRLTERGAVMLGKLNMDEFAMGSSTENSAFQTTKNPRDERRVPGGSSGGSAAAVAALEAPFTLGSDTGGSIRQPAAFCGVVGMKPTYGAISRYGLVAFASSLDQIGPVTKNVADSAIVLNALAAHDPLDSTSADRVFGGYDAQLETGVRGMRIALPEEFMGEGIAPDVQKAVNEAADRFRSLGATVELVSMSALKNALPAYYVISSAEASSNLSRFDGVRYGFRAQKHSDMDELYKNTRSEGFGAEVKRRILLGTFALSAGYYDAYYAKALKVKNLLKADFERIYQQYDMILSPVAPTVAYKIGEKTEDPLTMYMGDICTVPANIAGLPALSMPCGAGEEGMPVGMQLIGRAFDERTLYRAGRAFEMSREG